jgi:LysR family glycine cleavage system transcriptional activator
MLPPLSTLRAFAAVARHLSFTRAADELAVTQAAVSHQIRTLEEFLGAKLFLRRGRTIELTEAGQALQGPVAGAFDQLETAVNRLQRSRDPAALNVTVLPTLMQTWLIPRLRSFQTAHPEIDLRMSSSVQTVDLRRRDFDIALRFGRGDWPDLHTDFMWAEEIHPVCAPELLEGEHPLREPEDLKNHTLLHYAARTDHWRMWLTEIDPDGLCGVDPESGLHFDNIDQALQAAASGLGVAIGSHATLLHAISQGTLVSPLPFTLKRDNAFYLVCLPERVDEPNIAAFRDWALAQAAEMADVAA